MNAKTFHFPRNMELDGTDDQVCQKLCQCTEPLYPGATTVLPILDLSEALQKSLLSARRAGRLHPGMAAAALQLASERKGLQKLQSTTGKKQAPRISRLILLSNDGTDRFFRETEHLLEQNAPRVLALRLNTDSQTLGHLLLGKNRIAKLLLIAHKDAVVKVLQALI